MTNKKIGTENQHPITKSAKNVDSRGFLKILFDSIPQTSQDWLIIVCLVALIIIWIADLFILDPLPFVDEIVLPMIIYLIGQWYTNHKSQE